MNTCILAYKPFCMVVGIALLFTTPARATESDHGVITSTDTRNQKDLAFDLGVGLLEFIHLDITYLHSRSWTFGMVLGAFPIDLVLRKAMGVDKVEGQIDVEGLVLKGKVNTSLGSGGFWARWHPWAETFYLEGVLSVWVLDASSDAVLTHQSLQSGLPFTVAAKVWVPMFGLHIGWRIFWQSGAFLDLGLGLNILLTPGAEVKLSGTTVEEVSNNPEVATLLQQAQDELSRALKNGANSISADLKAFPTVFFRFGWAFDFW